MRHGNANWKDPEVADFERPLNRRGSAETQAMARRLGELEFIPALLIASPAQRSRQTAEILMRELELAARQVRYEEGLYLAQADDILRFIHATGPRVSHLLIVGHNPGISRLAHQLGAACGANDLDTAAICSMTFDTRAWSGVTADTVRDALCETPPTRLFASLLF
jgi:phosphohistidine phosphatase